MVTESGRPELSDISLDVEGVSDHPRGKLVRMRSTHPVLTRAGLVRKTAEGRAKGKALAVVGPLDATIDKVKSADIQRYTHIDGSPETVERSGNYETLEYDVVVDSGGI